MSVFSATSLIQNAIGSGGYTNMHTLVAEMIYDDFASNANINLDVAPRINHYINDISYTDKAAMFKSLGYEMKYTTLSFVKLTRYINHDVQHDTGQTLEEEMLDGKRNIIILEVTDFTKSIFFVLEYQTDKSLIRDFCDWDEIERLKKRKEQMKSIFNFNKY